MSEYTAQQYIDFIRMGRRDKVSPHGLTIIADEFERMQKELKKLKGEEEPIKDCLCYDDCDCDHLSNDFIEDDGEEGDDE